MQLFFFNSDINLAKKAEESGVNSIIVDLEKHGKKFRQFGYDTEINNNSMGDIEVMAKNLSIPITVRINPWGQHSLSEISMVLDKGAKIIMLPMAKHPSEIEKFVQLVNGRSETIIQIETQELVDHCSMLRHIGWNYAYIGLNDLMISRKSTWLWEPLLDGTIDYIMNCLDNRNLGFGAATIIGGGYPLPFINLLQEMARLKCTFTILRRTFKKEITNRNMKAEIQAIQTVWQAAFLRDSIATDKDHEKFVKLLEILKVK